MPFNFSEECKKSKVDEKFVRSIEKKLFPLLEKSLTINPNFNKFLSQRNKEVSGMTFSNFEVFQKLLDRITEQLPLHAKEVAVLFMIDYLVATESIVTYIVDFIVFALVSTGKNLEDPKNKDPQNRKFAILPEDIMLIPLGSKLDFLSANGFSMITKRCNVRIRNSSGHLNYTVDNDGNICLPQGDLIKIPDGFNEHHNNLRDAALGGLTSLRHFYYKKYGQYKV